MVGLEKTVGWFAEQERLFGCGLGYGSLMTGAGYIDVGRRWCWNNCVNGRRGTAFGQRGIDQLCSRPLEVVFCFGEDDSVLGLHPCVHLFKCKVFGCKNLSRVLLFVVGLEGTEVLRGDGHDSDILRGGVDGCCYGCWR